MASRKLKKEQLRQERLRREAEERVRVRRVRRLRLQVGGVVATAIVALAVVFALGSSGGGASDGEGKGKRYVIGNPGPGEEAPPIELDSTTGGFDLAALRGKDVLLYFQEGLMCQPCWDQLRDIEADISKFEALGVDRVVTITTDPIDALAQKADDEGLRSPVVSDPTLEVSRVYETNRYGMMGESRNGHSFIFVDGKGMIRWRADYGGDGTGNLMYVPLEELLTDMRRGLQEKAA